MIKDNRFRDSIIDRAKALRSTVKKNKVVISNKLKYQFRKRTKQEKVERLETIKEYSLIGANIALIAFLVVLGAAAAEAVEGKSCQDEIYNLDDYKLVKKE